MKSIIKQLYTILLVTVACLTVAGCSDDFKSNLRLDGDVWVNSIKLDEYKICHYEDDHCKSKHKWQCVIFGNITYCVNR